MNQQIKKLLCVFLFAIISTACSTIQNASDPSKSEVNKWFDSGTWSNGLNLKVYSDVTRGEFYKQYHANKPLWDKAFAYLRDNNLETLPVGKHPIVGDDLFATVTEPAEMALEQTKWESHRKYIDLQYVIKGKEMIMVADTSKLTVTASYAEAKDVANYTGEGKSYIAEPGTYYLFFPQDGHRPTIKVPGYDKVKKVVLKIAVAK